MICNCLLKVNILLDTAGPEADVLKDMMRATGVDIIKKKLSTYLTSLKEGNDLLLF